MNYITSGFNLQMVAESKKEEVELKVSCVTKKEFLNMLLTEEFESCLKHTNIINLIVQKIGFGLAYNPKRIKLNPGDCLYSVQFTGTFDDHNNILKDGKTYIFKVECISKYKRVINIHENNLKTNKGEDSMELNQKLIDDVRHFVEESAIDKAVLDFEILTQERGYNPDEAIAEALGSYEIWEIGLDQDCLDIFTDEEKEVIMNIFNNQYEEILRNERNKIKDPEVKEFDDNTKKILKEIYQNAKE